MHAAILALSLLATSSQSPTEQFERLVVTHVQAMLEKGYAQAISWDDLNHGHIFIARGKDDCYDGMDDLLSRTELILYHSAEHNYRWRGTDTPPEQKVPRSIIGFLDGTIQPAIEYVGGREALQSDLRYVTHGSIAVEDIVRKHPGWYHGNKEEDNTCVRTNGVEKGMDFEFYIGPDKNVVFGTW